MSNPVLIERLKSKVEGAISKYMNAIDTRPDRATYVFGQRVGTVSDARRHNSSLNPKLRNNS